MEVRSIGQLLQHEFGDISTCDFEFEGPGGARETMAILASAISIRKGCRPDDRPVQLALCDAVLLTYMICIRATQEEPKHDVLPEEIQIASTVPDAES